MIHFILLESKQKFGVKMAELIIVFREVLEASLIIGILYTFFKKLFSNLTNTVFEDYIFCFVVFFGANSGF